MKNSYWTYSDNEVITELTNVHTFFPTSIFQGDIIPSNIGEIKEDLQLKYDNIVKLNGNVDKDQKIDLGNQKVRNSVIYNTEDDLHKHELYKELHDQILTFTNKIFEVYEYENIEPVKIGRAHV